MTIEAAIEATTREAASRFVGRRGGRKEEEEEEDDCSISPIPWDDLATGDEDPPSPQARPFPWHVMR